MERVSGRRSSVRDRVWAACVAVACLAVLVIGAGLRPAGAGHGTHEQLGLPSCGWVSSFGKPCPTCGMTTAVSHAARGEFVSAALTQPAGLGIALLASALFWLGAHEAATGSRLMSLVGGALTKRVWWMVIGFVLIAWAYKVQTWGG